jgi:branched-chain amino acid transport system substrate-binding protein
MRIVSKSTYNAYVPFWRPIMAAVRAAHPDVLILASHIPDGVSFRRAMIAAHLHVGAFIGSTMAECGPEFGAALGPKAVGVFASDRPMGGFNPGALSAPARRLYGRLAAAWKARTGQAQPTEEALAGFTAGWALFHDVLPHAAGRGFTPSSVARAARRVNLPLGSLPNGAGLKFATDRAHLGQNTRASAVIWQWQAVRHSVVVWPASYATGHIRFVPLPS